jgi:structural maintenance of chromosome 4
MSQLSPQRPTRRAVGPRRRAIVDSDDDDLAMPVGEGEEEYGAAPKPSRRITRTKEATTPRASRVRKSQIPDLDDDLTMAADEPTQLPSPSKRASPRKKAAPRTSVRPTATRRTRVSEAVESPTVLPTPEPSASPEPETIAGAAVKMESPIPEPMTEPIPELAKPADIVSEPTEEPAKPVEMSMMDARITMLEKPMDIVVRTRQNAMPAVSEQTAPKARLVITYLVLVNFKSYAGRQEVGPFHASFSSVVGPNGSGKSNVIDSLLFVFGFRASKMRQGKLSALIHNSAQHPDLDFCEVEVHFQEVNDLPGGGHEVIPDSTLIISRRAFKNNSSNYYMNGKTSNFTTVTTLLRDRGIDLDHKRFLILQGEVESIAQMKPKAANEHDDGLLEYLEDIIGTSKYKTPIEEAAKEIEELNEVCMEKNNRVSHVEKEKNALEDKKTKALVFIRDENELTMQQSALYQVYTHECSQVVQVSQEAAGQIQQELDNELQKHQGSEEEIKHLEKQYKTSSKQVDALEKRTTSLLEEVAKLDKENVKLEEKKKFLTNKQKKLEKTLESSKYAISEAHTNIGQYRDDVERNSGQIEELEDKLKAEEAELSSIRESLQGKTQGLSNEIAAKQKSLEPWNEKIQTFKSSMAVAQSELEILTEKESSGAVAVADVETKIEGFHESKQTKMTELENCAKKLKDVHKQIERINAQLSVTSGKEPKLRSQLSEARQKADEARASLSASQTQGNVLSGLMRLKESGRISGFHGRLGNLGTIDSKYDVAISTACPALNNMVVDSVEVGQQCIDYLRKNNLGRANFILLDRLPQRDLSKVQTPENVPRLFDLVNPSNDKFRAAFFSVLQNTLVATDLSHANRIAYGAKRWRVVTLDGQLIDKSGTMSGGGTRVAKGGMSSKLQAVVSRDQVSKMEVDRDALENSLQELLKEQRDLNDALRDLNKQVPRLETESQKLSLEIASHEKNIEDAQRRIKELKSEQGVSSTDKSRAAQLEKAIVTSEREIQKLHSETAGIEQEIKALQDQIMEIGGVRLRSQKAKVDGLRGQIETLSDEMSSAEVNRSKAEKNKTKQEKAKKEAESELSKLEAEFEKVQGTMQQQGKQLSVAQSSSSEAQDELDTKKEELQGLKTDLTARTEELNVSRGAEIEMRNKLEENQRALQDADKRFRHWQEKLGKLSLHNLR